MAFKRINFFKGFFTKAEDWQNTETYHNEKRKLHNRGLHTPGIVYGLEVEAIKEGKAINVANGYAIDGQGRDLFLEEGKDIEFDGSEYEPDTPIYVVMKYNEQATDERPVHGEKRKEFAFIEESVNIAFATDPPDGITAIELARFVLAHGKPALKDPRNPAKTGPNEINRTCIKRAGSLLGRMTLNDIGELSKEEHITVAAKEESEDLIDTASKDDPYRFYLVSAYPDKDTQITWRIESRALANKIEYWLLFQNLGNTKAEIWYRVCCLR